MFVRYHRFDSMSAVNGPPSATRPVIAPTRQTLTTLIGFKELIEIRLQLRIADTDRCSRERWTL
jgi:hypothetical protein